jgi:hypothetical protein
MHKVKSIVIVSAIFVSLLLNSCFSGNSSSKQKFEKTPVDNIIMSLRNETDYSIILADMDNRGNDYFHKYDVIIEKPDTVLVENKDWEKVSDIFFDANINNLGMAIATKKDNKLSKVASPAGYNNFVGNEKYGRWTEGRNGGSFWEFYGKYAFLSSVFNMMSYPARRSYWDDYNGGGYYGRSPYYGPRGNTYGTKSYTNTDKGRKTTWSSKPSSFKQSVRSKVSQSAKASKSRISRSNSRYSRSSSRSRSGGFGK